MCGNMQPIWSQFKERDIIASNHFKQSKFHFFSHMDMLWIAKYCMQTPSPKVDVYLNSTDKKQKTMNVNPVSECIFPVTSFNKAA